MESAWVYDPRTIRPLRHIGWAEGAVCLINKGADFWHRFSFIQHARGIDGDIDADRAAHCVIVEF